MTFKSFTASFRAFARALGFVFALGFVGLAAQAQTVKVQDAWARATVPGQKASGAFMTLTAAKALRLVGVMTPVAGMAEVHETKMVGNVMQMRPVAEVALPAGRAVALKPGGYHIMLTGLKLELHPGRSIPLTLLFKDAQGLESRQTVQVPVQAMASGG